MSGVRETFQRNVDGLNDLLNKNKNEIKMGIKELTETNNYEDALHYLGDKIAAAVLEIEKRRKSVIEILSTKLKLSFDSANEGITSEWENAIIDAKSQIEMFGDSLKSEINKEFTDEIRIPSVEKFLIEAGKKKAFTRLTFDFISNRLKVPKNKVEEVAENLIFDGKLEARLDLPTETLIFVEEMKSMEPAPTKPSVVMPPPKPSPITKPPPKKESPQSIPISEGPQPIDLSMEPTELNLDILESPPEAFELLPETEPIDISIEPEVQESAQEPLKGQELPPESLKPSILEEEEEKEAASIISFFKSSVEELSEQDKEEAKRKREAKKKELEARKKKKQEEVKEKEEEALEKEEKEVEVPEKVEKEGEALEEKEKVEEVSEKVEKEGEALEAEEKVEEVPEKVETEEEAIDEIENAIEKVDQKKFQDKWVAKPTKASDLLKPEPKSEIKPSASTSPSVPPSRPPISLGFKPPGKISDVKRSKIQPPTPTKAVSELIIPSQPTEEEIPSKEEVSAPSDKIFHCIFCGKPVSLEDASVILCPHACGAMGHKEEFLKKGRCAKCKAEIKKIDIEFSELL